MKKTNRAAASVLAMLTGWATMMTLLLVLVAFQLPDKDVLYTFALYAVCSLVVVMLAWLVVCLPVYCLIPSDSAMFNWYIGGPIGATVGFAVGILLLEALYFGILAAVVGGVAGGVGHLFIKREAFCPMD